jgi:Domain of unknown function (DUF1772)
MKALMEFGGVFLLGLVTGVSFSHLLQRAPKATLPATEFLAVQQVLLRNYGTAMGWLEGAALVSTMALGIVTRREPVVPLLAIVASGCVLFMVVIWATWINPINQAVNSWTPQSIPPNWATLRDRWHLLHALRFGLSAVAFGALIGGLLR